MKKLQPTVALFDA